MGKGPAMREQAIKQFDKNGDGKLDQQEMAAARQAIQSRGMPGKGGPLGQGKVDGAGPGREEFLKRFDKNGDGKIDEQERTAARKAIEERRANIK
jgi:Ca2+-binding EF-hand superfamily protein